MKGNIFQIESSFNTMGDIMDTKSSSMEVDTYGSIQRVKYHLKARSMSAIQMFGNVTTNNRLPSLYLNMKRAYSLYKRTLPCLPFLPRRSATKKSYRLRVIQKAKERRLRHEQKLKKEARLERLRELQLVRQKWWDFRRGHD